MPWIVQNLWLVAALPMIAAGVAALLPQRCRKVSATLAIGSMVVAFLLSLSAFVHTLGHNAAEMKEVVNFQWLQFAAGNAGLLKLGWVLDPLTAVMLVMVTFVGTLIFIYSVGYMAHDENFTRFFTFLSLFAGGMLGVVIANSLLLLFMSWEIVGLTSYLLIGFWYHKPSAAAAAKKAFITTRIGDVFFFLGIMWLYSQTGTLLFYDDGAGCMEQNALSSMVAKTTCCGMAVSTAIGLLIFAGAVGKSGQVPLHVWLPDAMEGPTPVSALIHAATMVAAGVFLVARVYPLMGIHLPGAMTATTALQVVTWVGAITAVFAASIAVAQNDIKRILAYSTVSQLGYMMMGLGAGGVAVGMFHLITHAFFKALLFLGAGSVIHGCYNEQNIARMGGLRKFMPVTFVTYAIGMLALCGFPLVFSGFWSKDAILDAAHHWPISRVPFFLGVIGAFLTAFYMTRQMVHVFFGDYRVELGRTTGGEQRTLAHGGKPVKSHPHVELPPGPHESPASMTIPLVLLAGCTLLLGLIGTPAWPWFQSFLGEPTERGFTAEMVALMTISTVVVFFGLGIGWLVYSKRRLGDGSEPDQLSRLPLGMYRWLMNRYGIDEFYEITIVRLHARLAHVCNFLDAWVWSGAVTLAAYAAVGCGWFNRMVDEFAINFGFDSCCSGLRRDGTWFSRFQTGEVQQYLRIIGVALVILVVALVWGAGS